MIQCGFKYDPRSVNHRPLAEAAELAPNGGRLPKTGFLRSSGSDEPVGLFGQSIAGVDPTGAVKRIKLVE